MHWVERRTLAVQFLHQVAGCAKRPEARRIGKAADLYNMELRHGIKPICELLQTSRFTLRKRKMTIQLLETASEYSGEATLWLLEGVLMRARVHRPLIDCLLDTEDRNTRLYSDLIYMARAGIPPFKVLAAAKLAYLQRAQSRSTLTQLLFNQEENVTMTALWGLTRQGGIEPDLLTRVKETLPVTWERAHRAVSHLLQMPESSVLDY